MKLIRVLALLCVIWTWGCSKPEVRPPTTQLSILYNIEEQGSEKTSVAQVLQAQLGAKGITVKLDAVSNTVFYDRVGKGDFECVPIPSGSAYSGAR